MLIPSSLGEPEHDLAEIGRVLATLFPELDFGSLRLLERGFGSVVVQTHDDVIFRVARHARAAEGYAREMRLLPQLAPRLPVSVPQPQWRVEPGSPGLPFGALGYRRLAGELLSPGWLARHDMYKISSDIAGFLTALHGFPVDEAEELGVPRADLNGRGFEQLCARVLPMLRQVLDRDEYDTISRWSQDFVADALLQRFDPVLRHGDLWFGNILVNDLTGSIVAVLDWTSAAIGDPAEDLARQLHLGEPFAANVLRAYEAQGGAGDSTFRHRMGRRWELVEFAGLRTAMELDDPVEVDETIGKLRAGPILTGRR